MKILKSWSIVGNHLGKFWQLETNIGIGVVVPEDLSWYIYTPDQSVFLFSSTYEGSDKKAMRLVEKKFKDLEKILESKGWSDIDYSDNNLKLVSILLDMED
jgi:hypothetical protein